MVCWRWNGIKLLFIIIIKVSSLIHIRRITIKQLQLIQRSTNLLKSRLDLSSSAVALSSTDGESAVAAMDIRGSTCGVSFNSCINHHKDVRSLSVPDSSADYSELTVDLHLLPLSPRDVKGYFVMLRK
ncbi:hypothetical protein POTOM_055552 [Populus tomentosa]|uniref:Uncharacterized protein n=1 Tax=Populus tomentosa TaxID=118781 RepID=A0A8X7Y4I6_POPTO|nr:hypothetical protein POTOM_055552 [Populus tomentosa]